MRNNYTNISMRDFLLFISAMSLFFVIIDIALLSEKFTAWRVFWTVIDVFNTLSYYKFYKDLEEID